MEPSDTPEPVAPGSIVEETRWFDGLRRIMLAAFVVVVSAVLVLFGKMTGDTFSTVALGALAAFSGPDAVAKFKNPERPSKKRISNSPADPALDA